MISLILFKKIISLFLIMIMGFVLVKCKVVKASDSKIISLLSMYLIMPFSILMAYQKTFSAEVRNNMLLSLLAAVIAHIVFVCMTAVLGKIFKMSPEEKASVMYPNAGNLTFPLVTALFGSEWIIYASIFMSVQQIMIWTQGKTMLCGDSKPNIRKIVTNVNMICIFLGIITFIFRIKIPGILSDPMTSVGNMLGPCAMLVAGMILGGMKREQFAGYRRLPLVCMLRLLIYPLPCILIFKLSPLGSMTPDGRTLLLITMLAVSGPAAATITQLCQIYEKDADYASTIYVCTTILCMITMPAIIFLCQL